MTGIQFFVVIFLWIAIYGQRSELAGFTIPKLLTYFLLAKVMERMLNTKIFDEIREGVKTGTIANYLLLPINSKYIFMARSLGRMLTQLTLSGGVAIIIIALTPYFVAPASLMDLGLALLMLIVGVIMSMLLYIILGAIAFWTVETGNIVWSFTFIVSFISGLVVPLQFFPNWMKVLVTYSPFASLYNLAPSFYLGLVDLPIGSVITVQLLWVIVLWCLLAVIWQRGINRLELVGN